MAKLFQFYFLYSCYYFFSLIEPAKHISICDTIYPRHSQHATVTKRKQHRERRLTNNKTCPEPCDPDETLNQGQHQEQQKRLTTLLNCKEDRFTTTYAKGFANPWAEDRVGVKPQVEGSRLPIDTFVPRVLPDCEYRPGVRKGFKQPRPPTDKHQKGFVYEPLEIDPRELEWKSTYKTTICQTAESILNMKLLTKRKINKECKYKLTK